MKKLLALALALMMVFALAACGGKTDPAPSGNDGPGTSQQTEPPSTMPDNSNPSGEVKTPAEIAEELAGGFGTYNSKPIVWQVLSVDVANTGTASLQKDNFPFFLQIVYHAADTRLGIVQNLCGFCETAILNSSDKGHVF